MTLAWKRRRRGQVLPLCPFQPDALELPNKDSCLSSGSFLALQERPASRRRAPPRGRGSGFLLEEAFQQCLLC